GRWRRSRLQGRAQRESERSIPRTNAQSTLACAGVWREHPHNDRRPVRLTYGRGPPGVRSPHRPSPDHPASRVAPRGSPPLQTWRPTAASYSAAARVDEQRPLECGRRRLHAQSGHRERRWRDLRLEGQMSSTCESPLLAEPDIGYAFRKASRSALIVSASVVGIPCGKPLYVFKVLFLSNSADSGPESA